MEAVEGHDLPAVTQPSAANSTFVPVLQSLISPSMHVCAERTSNIAESVESV